VKCTYLHFFVFLPCEAKGVACKEGEGGKEEWAKVGRRRGEDRASTRWFVVFFYELIYLPIKEFIPEIIFQFDEDRNTN